MVNLLNVFKLKWRTLEETPQLENAQSEFFSFITSSIDRNLVKFSFTNFLSIRLQQELSKNKKLDKKANILILLIL